MKPTRKIGLSLLFLLLLGATAIYFLLGQPMLQILNGYAAKKACTCYYAERKTVEAIINDDLNFSPITLSQIEINERDKSVETSVYGLGKRTAQYRGDLGCILINGQDDYNIQYRKRTTKDAFIPYAVTDKDGIVIDRKKLKAAFDYAFEEQYTTEGALVIYKDSMLHEQYGPNVNAQTPLLGWSMTKSITSSIIGKLVKEGKLSLEQKSLFPKWTDDRKEITLNNMLQMQSGIEWEEKYDKQSDATTMLYNCDDIVSFMEEQPLEHTPGTHWEYSSGTSNLVMGLARAQFDSHQEFYQYVSDFFHRCGMDSAFIEPDESGNLIGSSYGYATTRDWARYGQLYMHQGYINGQQLIDTSWVEYSKTAVSDEVCQYGAHFWTNARQCHFPTLPADLYYPSGFRGQYVFIIPSLDLIVVRLGNSDIFDEEKFVRMVIDAVK